MRSVTISRTGQVEPREIEELRAAVGWDRCENAYGEILRRHFASYCGRDNDGQLVGFLTVLSDGVADALLLDLMVHPAFRQQGLGTRLVLEALSDIKGAGIRCVHVTFSQDLGPFFQKCGFHLLGGGIIDFGRADELPGKFGS